MPKAIIQTAKLTFWHKTTVTFANLLNNVSKLSSYVSIKSLQMVLKLVLDEVYLKLKYETRMKAAYTYPYISSAVQNLNTLSAFVINSAIYLLQIAFKISLKLPHDAALAST